MGSKVDFHKTQTIFRQLSAEEIGVLIGQGCSCADWSDIEVAEGFDASRVKTTSFSGKVRLGVFEKEVSFFGGVKKPSGISDAAIHNCCIGNNVYIGQVRNYIANYVIEDDVVVENVDLLAVEGESSFGNGTELKVVNEAGGREVPIYDNLSAHAAYIMAFYRHRPKAIEKLRAMAAEYTKSVTSSTGFVGKGSRLINCRIIKNIKAGPSSIIEGISRLEDGSVNSCPEDPVYIGPGVIAEKFIACSGSKITDGTMISRCFVGQGTVLGRQYSAEDSVFFANCRGLRGEACSIFAGPFTVTHHKSTLLIAGLFSFLNAGSGTNQSNHMYKLGPVHQGIVERGSKTASDSYMLWPARVGPFTVVMGRHYKNSDTSDMPFSYLIEHEDESILIPGVNLRSVGTVRDAQKWPMRDRRKGPENLDFINFQLLSPYTAMKMLKGCQLLINLQTASGEETEYFTYSNVMIKKSSLENGIKFYQMGIDKFLGNCLIRRLKEERLESAERLREILSSETDVGMGEWLDLAGLFVPLQVVEETLDDIEAGVINTFKQLAETFKTMHDNYLEYEWSWAAGVLQQRLGKAIDKITVRDIVEIIGKWKTSVVELDKMLYNDARKEFGAAVQINYGLDGNEDVRHSDFNHVRGTFEQNKFVCEIEKHIECKTTLAEELIGRVQKLC